MKTDALIHCCCYILTLADENREPVAALKRKLEPTFSDLTVFKGVDGRRIPSNEYYRQILRSLKKNDLLLSPGEMGCALSHVAILEDFIKKDKEIAIIFEDDAIVRECSIERLHVSLSHLSDADTLVLGSQEAVRQLGPPLGRAVYRAQNLYAVDPKSWKDIKGTFAYAVGRSAAAHIVAQQNQALCAADDYRLLCPATGRLLFCPAFSHPIDVSSSPLSRERGEKLDWRASGQSLASRIWRELRATIKARSAPIERWWSARQSGIEEFKRML